MKEASNYDKTTNSIGSRIAAIVQELKLSFMWLLSCRFISNKPITKGNNNVPRLWCPVS